MAHDVAQWEINDSSIPNWAHGGLADRLHLSDWEKRG